MGKFFTHSPWSLDPSEVLSRLNTSSSGLSSQEVDARLKLVGLNTIRTSPRTSRLLLFLRQLQSPLIFILIIAGLITVFLSDLKDAVVIFAAVLVNTCLGFYQENKAANALAGLDTYLRHRSLVIRSGHEQLISADSLVPGDIMVLLPGQRVPADGRLLHSSGLLVDEAILTGESLPVSKIVDSVKTDTLLADRSSMVWAGSLIVEGRAQAVVTSTGSRTEMGKIAELVHGAKDEATPLQQAISHLTLRLSLVLLALVVLLFGLGVYFGQDLIEMFITSVAVAISAIPEGLPIALTVILSIGVERMAKKKGIVKRLLAAETLGSTSVILTDKTGTLTEARMSLSQVISSNSDYSSRDILTTAVLATEAVIEKSDGQPSDWSVLGRPLEVSLIKEVSRFSVSPLKIRQTHIIEDQLPFNSSNKYSAVVVKHKSSRYLGVLGAPDILLSHTDLSSDDKSAILDQINELAHSGAKVLGVAVKPITGHRTVNLTNRSSSLIHLTFCGLLAFNDPLRSTVKKSIAQAAALGVTTVIVTGDHLGTAEAVAQAAGLDLEDSLSLTGDEINKLGMDKLKQQLSRVKIFARVTPEQKLAIVRLYKKSGAIVAMTGDGVNDAPALKEANIGVAVGSGTDVAKGAADLIITDDNFGTIVAAIGEGRKTLSNIKKVIVYLLSSIIDELVLVGGSILAGIAIPLTAVQILWVNFFSDSFPAIGLAFEDSADDIKNLPTATSGGLIDAEMKFLIMVIGVATSLLLFVVYYWLLALGFNDTLVRTFTFASFGLYTLMFSFSMRNLKRSILDYSIFSNEYLSAGIGVGVILMLAAIYFPPLQSLMGTVALPPLWFAGVLLLGLVSVVAVEWGKWLFRERVNN